MKDEGGRMKFHRLSYNMECGMGGGFAVGVKASF